MITVLVAVILVLMQSMVNSQSYIQVSAVSPYTAYIHIEGPLVRPINLTSITSDIKCGVLEYGVVNGSLINVLLKVPWNGRLLICNLTLLLGTLETEPKLILVNTSKVILISVSLSQGNLTVAYMGIDWFLFALSILLLTWQIPTIAVFGRMALKKQVTSTKAAQIYSFSIITSFPLQIIWLVLFLIGLSAGLLYFEPLLYVLRPIIGDYQWNLGLSIIAPVVLAIVLGLGGS